MMKEFNAFEKLFIELVGEFKAISANEERLREVLRAESARAEAAEVAREAAERAASEARSSATAAATSATQAAAALAHAQEELTGCKMQFDLVERQRSLLEDRCAEMSLQVSSLERDLQQLRPLQNTHAALQKQYVDLQERIRQATADARNESTRLEAELRRVERSASGGCELRERARLAAAAHARERRLTAAELHHANKALLAANAETARLGALVTELQYRISTQTCTSKCKSDGGSETVDELRAALEAERAGLAKLERALAASIADNASLAASLHANDNSSSSHTTSTPEPASTKIGAIDSFLAD